MFKSIHILYPVFYVFCWRVIQKYSEKARCGHTTAFVRRTYILKKKYLFCFDKYCFFLHIFVVSFFFFSPFFSDDKYHVIDIVLCVFVLLLCVLSLSSAWIVIYMFNNIKWGPRDAILSSRHRYPERNDVFSNNFIICLIKYWKQWYRFSKF